MKAMVQTYGRLKSSDRLAEILMVARSITFFRFSFSISIFCFSYSLGNKQV